MLKKTSEDLLRDFLKIFTKIRPQEVDSGRSWNVKLGRPWDVKSRWTSPGWSNRMFRGRSGVVGGGRPQDTLGLIFVCWSITSVISK